MASWLVRGPLLIRRGATLLPRANSRDFAVIVDAAAGLLRVDPHVRDASMLLDAAAAEACRRIAMGGSGQASNQWAFQPRDIVSIVKACSRRRSQLPTLLTAASFFSKKLSASSTPIEVDTVVAMLRVAVFNLFPAAAVSSRSGLVDGRDQARLHGEIAWSPQHRVIVRECVWYVARHVEQLSSEDVVSFTQCLRRFGDSLFREDFHDDDLLCQSVSALCRYCLQRPDFVKSVYFGEFLCHVIESRALWTRARGEDSVFIILSDLAARRTMCCVAAADAVLCCVLRAKEMPPIASVFAQNGDCLDFLVGSFVADERVLAHREVSIVVACVALQSSHASISTVSSTMQNFLKHRPHWFDGDPIGSSLVLAALRSTCERMTDKDRIVANFAPVLWPLMLSLAMQPQKASSSGSGSALQMIELGRLIDTLRQRMPPAALNEPAMLAAMEKLKWLCDQMEMEARATVVIIRDRHTARKDYYDAIIRALSRAAVSLVARHQLVSSSASLYANSTSGEHVVGVASCKIVLEQCIDALNQAPSGGGHLVVHPGAAAGVECGVIASVAAVIGCANTWRVLEPLASKLLGWILHELNRTREGIVADERQRDPGAFLALVRIASANRTSRRIRSAARGLLRQEWTSIAEAMVAVDVATSVVVAAAACVARGRRPGGNGPPPHDAILHAVHRVHEISRRRCVLELSRLSDRKKAAIVRAVCVWWNEFLSPQAVRSSHDETALFLDACERIAVGMLGDPSAVTPSRSALGIPLYLVTAYDRCRRRAAADDASGRTHRYRLLDNVMCRVLRQWFQCALPVLTVSRPPVTPSERTAADASRDRGVDMEGVAVLRTLRLALDGLTGPSLETALLKTWLAAFK